MKNKLKTTKFYKYFRDHKKISISLIVLLSFTILVFALSYSRYVKDTIEMYYLRSQNFYFNSDKLTIHGKEYEINPWEGNNGLPYHINIHMTSLLNDLKYTTDDIKYKISCDADPSVDCYIGENQTDMSSNEENRVISDTNHMDNVIVSVVKKPGVNLSNNTKIHVNVNAESLRPYKEKLTATFVLVIGNYGLNFEIEDAINRNHFNVLVTNTKTNEDARITLKINKKFQNEIAYDMSNSIRNNKDVNYVEKVTEMDGKKYITEISFNLKEKSSLMIGYYKKNTLIDYSYNYGDTSKEPVISFSYQ